MFFKSYNPHINSNYIPSLETGKFSCALFIEDTCLLAFPFSLFSSGQIRWNIAVYHISCFSTTTYLEGLWGRWTDKQSTNVHWTSLRTLVTYAGYLLIIFLSEVPHRHSNYSHLAVTVTCRHLAESIRGFQANSKCRTILSNTAPTLKAS